MSDVKAEARRVAHLGRQGLRRLKEIADGRSHSVVSWPKTFERLVECGFAEIVEHRITQAQFARITPAGWRALTDAETEAGHG